MESAESLKVATSYHLQKAGKGFDLSMVVKGKMDDQIYWNSNDHRGQSTKFQTSSARYRAKLFLITDIRHFIQKGDVYIDGWDCQAKQSKSRRSYMRVVELKKSSNGNSNFWICHLIKRVSLTTTWWPEFRQLWNWLTSGVRENLIESDVHELER